MAHNWMPCDCSTCDNVGRDRDWACFMCKPDFACWQRSTGLRAGLCDECSVLGSDDEDNTCEGCANQGQPLQAAGSDDNFIDVREEEELDGAAIEAELAPSEEKAVAPLLDGAPIVEKTLADIRMDLENAQDRINSAGEADPTGLSAKDPGAKNDAGKTRWSLLPWEVIEGVAKVMTFGANKYSDNGWQQVPQAKDRYFSALMRHWRYMQEGQYLDDGVGGTGLPHWSCFVCNAVFLGYFYLKDHNKGD